MNFQDLIDTVSKQIIETNFELSTCLTKIKNHLKQHVRFYQSSFRDQPQVTQSPTD